MLVSAAHWQLHIKCATYAGNSEELDHEAERHPHGRSPHSAAEEVENGYEEDAVHAVQDSLNQSLDEIRGDQYGHRWWREGEGCRVATVDEARGQVRNTNRTLVVTNNQSIGQISHVQ